MTNAIDPMYLPEVASVHHPTPWRFEGSSEEGHVNVYDANGDLVTMVCVFMENDYGAFLEKMKKINAAHAEKPVG